MKAPIFYSEIRDYNSSKFGYDIKAALNVALLSIPQSIAYAAIAEIPIYYGLISSVIASIIAPFFASSRYTILGPTNATAFMLASFFAIQHFTPEQKIIIVPAIVLLSGIFCLSGALLKTGELCQFISRSVLTGYITIAAILIISKQLKHTLGVAEHIQDANFFQGIYSLGKALIHTHWQTLTISLATLTIYLIFQKKHPKLPSFTIALILISIILAALKASFPQLQLEQVACFAPFNSQEMLPDWSIWQKINWQTTLTQIIGISFGIAFLSILENNSMAKSLAISTGENPDSNKDMLAVGMANIACAFLGPMPASGSLTRSSLNHNSGAKTRFSSFYSGILCLIGLIALTFFPLISNIPKSALATLIIMIALSLLKPKTIKICLRTTKGDAAVLLTTALSALFLPLHYSIFIGCGLSLVFYLQQVKTPTLKEYTLKDEQLKESKNAGDRPDPAIAIIQLEGSLFFATADLLRTHLQKMLKDKSLQVIILRIRNARDFDASAMIAFKDLIENTQKNNKHLLISGANRETHRVLKNSGVLKLLQKNCDKEAAETNLFFSHPNNPNISTRDALIRAQKLIGNKEAEIQIFNPIIHEETNQSHD